VSTIRAAADVEQARIALVQLPLKGLEQFVQRAGRPQDEVDAARERADYRLSDKQARAILDMRLARLTGLEREKLAKEYGQLCALIQRLRAILGDEHLLLDLIVEELDEIRERYGDERRTEIVAAEGDISIEDLIADEDVVVTVTHAGYIKRVPMDEYRAQGRGGRGTRAMETRGEDVVEQIFVANNHAHVLFLNDKGKAYLKRIYEIPQASRAARGRAIVNFVGMDPGDRVAAIVPVREFIEGSDLITCTRKGRVKRTALDAYSNIRANGIIGVAIEQGDALLSAKTVHSGQDVLLGTAKGLSIRFAVDEARRMGRDSRGVKGIELRAGDTVIGMGVIDDEEQQVLTVSANGYGKRTPIGEWRRQGRGGMGVIAMDASDRNGDVVCLALMRPEHQLMVITDEGQVLRTMVDQLRLAGRNTQGVRVMRLGRGERVVDVALVAEREEEDGEQATRPGAAGLDNVSEPGTDPPPAPDEESG
ncbi:MAG: DNA gyrase subunit A, partial [Proteobacteria bacterium]|nr:DNA gyrase subunit A [Pseudomonadota bacterium]